MRVITTENGRNFEILPGTMDRGDYFLARNVEGSYRYVVMTTADTLDDVCRLSRMYRQADVRQGIKNSGYLVFSRNQIVWSRECPDPETPDWITRTGGW